MNTGSKIKLYLDCDDTIMKSSQMVIDILNKRYNIDKTVEDLKDWHYKSITPLITTEEVLDIYDSDLFWNNVELNDVFVEFYGQHKNDFEWIIVTKGRHLNLIKKILYLKRTLGDNIQVKGLQLHQDKNTINMQGGIQIDDRTDLLTSTNAECKILLTNGRKLSWNRVPMHQDNFYVVKDWVECGESLEFFLNNPEFMERCYK